MQTSIKHNTASFYNDDNLVIDQPSEIREQMRSAQGEQQYLALILCAKHFRVFAGSNHQLTEMKVSVPDHVAAYENDIAEKVTNFSDVSGRKEVMLDKFLRHIDQELTHIRNDHPYPIFVLGTKRTAGHFKKLTHNTAGVIKYIHGNYDEATTPELMRLLDQYIPLLHQARQDELMEQLSDAMDAHKLVWGIHEVWRYAMQNKGRMLVVEDGFYYPSDENGIPKEAVQNGRFADHSHHSGDAVDVLIKKILDSGGKVEFTDRGLLEKYESIALVQYY